MSQTSIVTAIAFGRKKSMASSSDTHSGSLKRKRQLLPLGAPPSENVLSRLIAINIQLIQYYRLLRYQLQSSGRLFEQIVCLINKITFEGLNRLIYQGHAIHAEGAYAFRGIDHDQQSEKFLD